MKKSTVAVVCSFAVVAIGCKDQTLKHHDMKSNNPVTLSTPAGLHQNPAYSQLAVVTGMNKTVYVGGQNAVDSAGNVVGKGDLAAQTKQVLINLEKALQAGGAAFGNVIKWTLYVKEGQQLEAGLKAFQAHVGQLKNPPLISMIFVAGLANPDYLLEMDAIAVVPD